MLIEVEHISYVNRTAKAQERTEIRSRKENNIILENRIASFLLCSHNTGFAVFSVHQ